LSIDLGGEHISAPRSIAFLYYRNLSQTLNKTKRLLISRVLPILLWLIVIYEIFSFYKPEKTYIDFQKSNIISKEHFEIPIQEIMGMPNISCMIDGEISNFILDTGMTNGLAIFSNSQLYNKNKVVGHRREGGYTASGPSDEREVINSIKLSLSKATTIEIINVDVLPPYPYDADGIIGFCLMKELGVSIDLNKMMISHHHKQ
jgi:hypothetical protein